MPAKDMKPNLWQQQRFGQNLATPKTSKETSIEEEVDVDAPKQTRLSGSGNGKIKSKEKVDVYASLRTIRSDAIQSLLAKMRVEHERLCAAAAVGSESTTLSNNHGGSVVLPTSLAAWDVQDDEPQQSTTEETPDWNLRFTDKETDKHLTNVELMLRLLNEVKDRARKDSVTSMAASPFPRWILGALYEMRLAVAVLDAHGEGMLSYCHKHALGLAKMAVRELEEMKEEAEKDTEVGGDVWGTLKDRKVKARPSQTLQASEVEGEPHLTAASTSTQCPAAVSEEKNDAAQFKREGQQTRDNIKREDPAANQQDESEDECWNWTEEDKAAKVKQMLAALNKGEERKTVFIGEVDGKIVYHFFELAGQVLGVTRPRLEDDPVYIQQYTSRQMMDTLLNHELAIVRQTGRRMFTNGIMEVVDKDGNPIH